jgi:hypothetical protein
MNFYSSLTESAAHWSSFIERIKKVKFKINPKSILHAHFQDFGKATKSVSFFICIRIRNKGNLRGISSSAENAKTDEKLVIKEAEFKEWWIKLLISRHPSKAAKKWVQANEEEILEWDADKLNRRIYLDKESTIRMYQ